MPTEIVSYCGKKLEGYNFQGKDLSHVDFRNATLHKCNFNNCDLSYADFSGADCDQSSFLQARLYRTNMSNCCLSRTLMDPRDFFGTTITVHCNATAGMKMGPLWTVAWLEFLLIADIPEDQKKKIKEVAESIIGVERLKGLHQAFTVREI